MKKRLSQMGQSTAEFVLVAPLLFFIFFCIIQLAYMGYVSFAVQRAALAVARKASFLTRDGSDAAFKGQLVLSLLPITNLSSKTLLTILETKCDISTSTDQKQKIAKVSYPMPIWVPMVRNLFGQDLLPSQNYNDSPEGQAIKTAFSLLGQQAPDLSFSGVRLPVVWVNFESSTYNEANHN